jgi:hypothetical protein
VKITKPLKRKNNQNKGRDSVNRIANEKTSGEDNGNKQGSVYIYIYIYIYIVEQRNTKCPTDKRENWNVSLTSGQNTCPPSWGNRDACQDRRSSYIKDINTSRRSQ